MLPLSSQSLTGKSTNKKSSATNGKFSVVWVDVDVKGAHGPIAYCVTGASELRNTCMHSAPFNLQLIARLTDSSDGCSSPYLV
jgi:hypothetical protein